MEAQARTEVTLKSLTTTVAELSARMDQLVRQLEQFSVRMDRFDGNQRNFRGQLLELQFGREGPSYFSRVLRRTVVVEPHRLEDVAGIELSDEDASEVDRLDYIIRGQSSLEPGRPTIWIAIELSGLIEETGVDRAGQRAAAMRKYGLRTVPAVVGEAIDDEAGHVARAEHVVVVLAGRLEGWEEAVGAISFQSTN